MSHPDFDPIPERRVVSAQTAAAEGYESQTKTIKPDQEPDLFRSVQASMEGGDWVWIEFNGRGYQAARHRRELLPVEQLVSADERRSDPIVDHVPQTRPKHKVRGVLAALDKLDRQTANRRCER